MGRRLAIVLVVGLLAAAVALAVVLAREPGRGPEAGRSAVPVTEAGQRGARPGAPPRAETSRSRLLGEVPAPVTEASGLAASRANPRVVWTHNDSGGEPNLYALGSDGEVRATLPLAGAGNIDWEDMARGPGAPGEPDWLYAGDIGATGPSRDSVRLYRAAEPDLGASAAGAAHAPAPAGFVNLLYPDGPRDAEALVVDPGSGDLFVITKREDRSRVYRARAPAFAGETVTLEYLRELREGLVTAADACPDGKTVLVRSYFGLDAYTGSSVAAALRRPPSPRLAEIEPQGETVAAAPDCRGYYTLSEGSGQPLIRYLR
ncbi:MAG: hypothetical protein ACKOTA_09085 [Solirubrobacterales bacterium]